MEFNFETPLILRLRKIAHSKTMLWCGILFAVYPIFCGWGLIYFSLSNPTLESLLQITIRFIFFILPCISFFVVYMSARNKDAVLPTGGFTAAGILCALAGVFFGITLLSHLNFLGLGEMYYYILFSTGPGNPGKILEHEMVQIKIVGFIAIVVFEIFFATLSTTFFSAASVARNNKPKKFFAIILTIVSFVILAFYIIFYTKNVINGRVIDIVRYFYFSPKYAIQCILNEILVFFLPIATMLLCGCMGIGFAKASRRIK